MKILICSDKFKGSLSAQKVCQAIEKGLLVADPGFVCTLIPLADGGDGTTVILKETLQLEEIKTQSSDPLGRPITVSYYCNATTAYIELAEASGMWRLDSGELDVMTTTTVGTGVLINDAISKGFKQIVLCLGGSCTNDVGLGIAHALGFSFLDAQNQRIIPSGGKLLAIQKIIPAAPKDLSVRILCDVTNPLYGPQGAAHIYARQKGASNEEIDLLDQGMRQVAALIEKHSGKQIAQLAGAGAAGGVAAGLYGLLDGVVIENGFDYLSSVLGLSESIAAADLVLTGEGSLDRQSLQGKVIGKVAALAGQSKIPVIAIVGQCSLSAAELQEAGIKNCATVLSIAESQNDAMARAEFYISQLAQTIGRNILNWDD